MKKTDLEKSEALKVTGKFKAVAAPGRDSGAAPAPDRCAQRASPAGLAKG